MLRWLYRICMKGNSGMVIFVGFILLYLLFIQSDLGSLSGENEIINPIEATVRHEKVKVPAESTTIKQRVQKHANYTNVKSIVQNANDWKQVYGSNGEFFVYSAYYDRRKPKTPFVRIVAIQKRRIKINECLLYYGDGSTEVVAATLKPIKEGWNLQFVASFILCSVPVNVLSPPTGVAIIKDNTVLLPSFQVTDLTNRRHEGFMSVCVKPFHYEFNRAVWLVEFIELHQLLGVNKFFFYNHTVGPDVEELLDYYVQRGIAVVFPWNLPVVSQKEIRTEGIFAALNDCNLRNVGRYNLTIMIDIDEYIIPRIHSNYSDMIRSLGNHNSYIFQNVFYYMYWDNDTQVINELYSENGIGTQLFGSEEVAPFLLTIYKTTRVIKPNKFGSRSKYIVKPEKAIECGNHLVWEYADGKKGMNVKENVALVNHYRICEGGGFDCINKPHVVDRAAHKWRNQLLEMVAESCSTIYLANQLCPPAPPLGNPW